MTQQLDPNEHLADALLPPMQDTPRNLSGDDFTWVPLDPGYEVAEYHPLPDGQGEPTEILIAATSKQFKLGIIIRLKSERAVNEMIATLRRHRDSVFRRQSK